MGRKRKKSEELRQAENMFEYMDKAENIAKKAAKLYSKACIITNNGLGKFISKFSGKNKISLKNITKIINLVGNKTNIDDFFNVMKRIQDNDVKEKAAELQEPKNRYKLELLKQKQKQIDVITEQIYKKEKEITAAYYKDLAKEAYNKAMFEIQQKVGIAFNFTQIDEKQIRAVLEMEWTGSNYSERIWNNTQKLAEDLKQDLIINLITGRTERELAKIYADRYTTSASNARRLIRTESCRIANEIQRKVYIESGIAKYIYLATLDLRTSETCRALDGQIFDVNKAKVGINYPPMHPWCRSTTMAYFDKDTLNSMQRRARGKDGKNYTLDKYINYKDWYKQYVKGGD